MLNVESSSILFIKYNNKTRSHPFKKKVIPIDKVVFCFFKINVLNFSFLCPAWNNLPNFLQICEQISFLLSYFSPTNISWQKNSSSLVIKLTVCCSQSLQTKQTVYKIEKKLGKSQRDQNKSKKDLFS